MKKRMDEDSEDSTVKLVPSMERNQSDVPDVIYPAGDDLPLLETAFLLVRPGGRRGGRRRIGRRWAYRAATGRSSGHRVPRPGLGF